MLVSGDGVVNIDEREAAQERKLASQPRHEVHYVHLVVSLVHLVVSSISTTPSPETNIYYMTIVSITVILICAKKSWQKSIQTYVRYNSQEVNAQKK